MRLLSDEGPPDWHPAPAELKTPCAEAAKFCRDRGPSLGRLALQFSVANPHLPTHIVGTADPRRITKNVREIGQPLDEETLAGVLEILHPVHNLPWASGRPENN